MSGKTYDRQPGESSVAFDAFCLYRDSGVERRIHKVALECMKNSSLLRRWSSTHEWRRRAQAFDDDVQKQRRAQHLKDIAEADARHRQIARVCQRKIVERLQTLKPEELSPSDVMRWLDVTTRLERDVLGVERGVAGHDPHAEEGEVLLIALSRPDRIPGRPLDEDEEY